MLFRSRALDNTPENLKDLVKSNTAKVDAAKKALDKAKSAADSAVATATQYYKNNKAKIEAEAAKGQSDPEKLAALKEARDRAKAAGISTAAYDGQIKALETKIATPAKTTDTTATGTKTDGTKVEYRKYADEIATAGKAIAKMSASERKALATSLAAAGFKVPTDGNYSDALIAGYKIGRAHV